MNPKFLQMILNSQKSNGCFSIDGKTKRNYNIDSNGCSDHTTGLGIAVLALYHNYYKQYYQ